MSAEPTTSELGRNIDQLRQDVNKKLDDLKADTKDDLADVKADINGVGGKIDGLYRVFASVAEHNALRDRVTALEGASDKRLDRVFTVWLGIGLAFLSAVLAIVLPLVTR